MTIDCLCPLEIGTLWEIGRDRDWFVLDSQVTTQSVKKWEKTVFPFECFCTCLSLSGFWELLDFSFRYKMQRSSSCTEQNTAYNCRDELWYLSWCCCCWAVYLERLVVSQKRYCSFKTVEWQWALNYVLLLLGSGFDCLYSCSSGPPWTL